LVVAMIDSSNCSGVSSRPCARTFSDCSRIVVERRRADRAAGDTELLLRSAPRFPAR
jgi:hypothetical protein